MWIRMCHIAIDDEKLVFKDQVFTGTFKVATSGNGWLLESTLKRHDGQIYDHIRMKPHGSDKLKIQFRKSENGIWGNCNDSPWSRR